MWDFWICLKQHKSSTWGGLVWQVLPPPAAAAAAAYQVQTDGSLRGVRHDVPMVLKLSRTSKGSRLSGALRLELPGMTLGQDLSR